jgi:hypothetical protein
MEMGDERTERPEAYSGFGGLDLDRGRSLELAIPIVKRTVLLPRLLRERADAADRLDADDARKSSAALGGVARCMQKGALEISAKAAPDYTAGSVGPRESEASSEESRDPRKRIDRSRTGKTTTQPPDCSGPPAARRSGRPSGHPSETGTR